MWRIILLLVVSSCYSSGKQLPPAAPELPASPAVPADGSRIIGGTPTTIEQFPFVVQITDQYNALLCSGSLLTEWHVLSAAHCFVDSQGGPIHGSFFDVRVGTSSFNVGGSTLRGSEVTIHERYDHESRDNDVAVLRMLTVVTFSDRVALAKIPIQDTAVPDGVQVTIVGWGRFLSAVNLPSPILNEAMVYTVNTDLCALRYGQLPGSQPFPDTGNIICSGVPDVGGRGVCDGDEGGPVVYNGEVVGVISFADSCADPTNPEVSMRVSAYTDWIMNITRPWTEQPNHASSFGQTSACLLLLSFLISTVLQ